MLVVLCSTLLIKIFIDKVVPPSAVTLEQFVVQREASYTECTVGLPQHDCAQLNIVVELDCAIFLTPVKGAMLIA